MLVLSRKAKEGIRIGPDVVVKVVSIKGNTVRLGIEAPKWVHVAREELDQKRGSDGKVAG